ncbi:MAG TPA: sulfite exporter TauE/SafE family protein [Xanthobacteraceae bacterium]|jgi:hypothetical protein
MVVAQHMLGIAGLALVSGVLIGCIGIGGVLLVPCLTLAGIDVHTAIGASMFSYIFSGAIGVALYARHGSIAWGSAALLAAGAAPGAFLGAVLAAHTTADVLLMLVGATVVFAGWRVLRRQSGAAERGDSQLARLFLVGVGATVGVGSALTGTGGPVLLVPLLMWWGVPVLTSVGLSQAIQVPIALLGTLGNFWTGSLEPRLSGVLSVGVAIGSIVGARIAHAVPAAHLARIVALALVLVGAVLALRSGHTLATGWR